MVGIGKKLWFDPKFGIRVVLRGKGTLEKGSVGVEIEVKD
jgi:hypothetical protein